MASTHQLTGTLGGDLRTLRVAAILLLHFFPMPSSSVFSVAAIAMMGLAPEPGCAALHCSFSCDVP